MLKPIVYTRNVFKLSKEMKGDKQHFKKTPLTLLPLIVVFLLWLPNLKESVQAQLAPPIPPTKSPTPTLSPATSPTSPPSTVDLSTTLKQQIVDEVKKQQLSDEVKQQITNEVKKQQLEEKGKDQDDLLNTVYLSLLSTVITVAIFVLGLNWFSNVVQREAEKNQIKKEVKQEALSELNEILNNQLQDIRQKNQELFAEMSKQLDTLKITLKLMESEIARLSAEQMSSIIVLDDDTRKKKLIYKCPKAIEEHIHSLYIIQQIQKNQDWSSNENTIGIFSYCLDAANDIVEYLKSEKIEPFFTIEQINKIRKMLNEIDTKQSTELANNIREFMKELENRALKN